MEYHFAPGSTATIEIPCFHLPGGPIVTTHGWLEGGVFPKIALAIRGSYFKYRGEDSQIFWILFLFGVFWKGSSQKIGHMEVGFFASCYRRPPVI